MENENVQVTQAPQKKKGKKKWIILAVVIVLFVAIISSGSSEPTVENPSVDNSASQSEKSTDTTKSATSEIKAGSSVSDESLKITYKSCNSNFTDYSPYADIASGNKVIQAVFDFENISSTDISLNNIDCYADGVKCEIFYSVDDYSSPTLESISSGRKLVDATVYFEVPENAEKIELEYEADFWDDEKYVFIVE